MLFLKPKRPPAEQRLQQFFQRFMQRTIIVHAGFDADWLVELIKQPGGGGHLRLDIRKPPGKRPHPLEWVVHEHVLTLDLPLPLLIVVKPEGLYLRHLTRGERAVHPSEILWFLDEIDNRYHALMRSTHDGFQITHGIAIDDNIAEAIFGL